MVVLGILTSGGGPLVRTTIGGLGIAGFGFLLVS